MIQKNQLSYLVLVLLTVFCFALGACNNKGGGNSSSGDAAKTEHNQDHGHDHEGHNHDKQGKEYTSAYICPMHCEGSGSDKPGKCPVCEMDYVKNDGHQH